MIHIQMFTGEEYFRAQMRQLKNWLIKEAVLHHMLVRKFQKLASNGLF